MKYEQTKEPYIAFHQPVASCLITDENEESVVEMVHAGQSTSIVSPPSYGVVCPDGASECQRGYTCCPLEGGNYGCCPYSNAVCCDDEQHCCPSMHQCSLDSKYHHYVWICF